MRKICYLIWDYHSGTLDANKSRDFEEHLKACPSCQAKLNFLNGLHEGLSELGNASEIKVSPEEKKRIMRKWDEKWNLKIRKNLSRWKLAYTFSLVVICFLSLIFLFLARSPSLTPSPNVAMFRAQEEGLLPAKTVLPGNEAQLPQYQEAYYLRVSPGDLASLSSTLSQSYLSVEGARIYVFPDKNFLSALSPVKPLDKIEILTSVRSSYSLPEGNYLMILEEANPPEKEEGLLFQVWLSEMRLSFWGWYLLPLFLAFFSLGFYGLTRRRFLLILFCLFFLTFVLLPTFLGSHSSAYLYLGNPEKLVSNDVLARETTSQYGRIFVSQEKGQSLLKFGFYLPFEPMGVPGVPNILESLNWGQENSFQVFYFLNPESTLFLALAIFLTKAIFYLTPLLLLVTFLLGPGKERKAVFSQSFEKLGG
jgi:hypothetical protein